MKKSRLTIRPLPEGGYTVRQSLLFPVCGWVLLIASFIPVFGFGRYWLHESWMLVIVALAWLALWMIGVRLVALSEWYSLTVSRESVCLRRFLGRKKVLLWQDVAAWGFSADTVILDRSTHRACYRFYVSPVRLKRIGKLRRDFRKKRGILMISLWPREAIALSDSGIPSFCAACLEAVRETPPPMDVSNVERMKKYYS